MGRGLGCALVAAILMSPPSVVAQDVAAPVEQPDTLGGSVDPTLLTHPWGYDRDRLFVTMRFDAGVFFFRPRFSVGYGRPFWRWVGLEGNPILSANGAAGYVGLRGALPHIDLRLGGRFQTTFNRSFLVPSRSYEQAAIELRNGRDSQYLSLEAELSWDFALGPGNVFGEAAVTAVNGVPEGFYVYEETVRVVARPPWIYRARLGYGLRFGLDDAIRMGVAVELVGNPGRGVVTFRGGIVAGVRLTRAWYVRGTFIPAIAGPDNLGLDGGDAFLLGVRYRWATGARPVEAPAPDSAAADELGDDEEGRDDEHEEQAPEAHQAEAVSAA